MKRNMSGYFLRVGGGLRPGPLWSALVWSVSDTGAVLSVSFGQFCSPETDKTALLSAPVHTAPQTTTHLVNSNHVRVNSGKNAEIFWQKWKTSVILLLDVDNS